MRYTNRCLPLPLPSKCISSQSVHRLTPEALKMLDRKLTDKFAGVENEGQENNGQEFDGQENDEQQHIMNAK